MHHRTLRCGPAAAAALLLVAALPAGATDTVDLQIAAAAKVKGTIRDFTERERFVLDLPAGATIKAKAKPKGKLAPIPSLDFVDATDATVAMGTVKGRNASLVVPALGATGRFRLRLTGDGANDGDYQLQVVPKYRTTFTGAGATVGPDAESFTFAAPANAKVKIEVKPALGSAFLPSLQMLDGPGGYDVALTGGGRFGPVKIGPGGDYTVFVTSAGGDGDFTWKATVTAARVPPANIDITAKALSGEFTYGQPVLGREVGAEGGFLDPSAEGVPLEGTSLDVPAGALAVPTVLTIAESTPFLVAQGINATGPAIRFGPPGTQFLIPATVTIPFDASAYTDPATEMTIYILNEETGLVEEAPKPYDFSGDPGTVTFPTSHFSTFLSTNTRPRNISGDWIWVRMRAGAQSFYNGNHGFAVGDVTFDPAGGWSSLGYGPGTAWGTDDGNKQPFVFYPGESLPAGGGWSVPSDAQVNVIDAGQVLHLFSRGLSSDVLVETNTNPAPTDEVGLSFMLRRTRAGATAATTLGRWHFVRVSARAFVRYDPVTQVPSYSLDGTAAQGTITFQADGNAKIELAGTPLDAESQFPVGTWDVDILPGAPPSTWTAYGDVNLYIGGSGDIREDIPPVRLRPTVDGNVLVGIDGDSFQDDADAALMILVRESGDARRSDMFGDFTAYDFETTFRDAPLPAPGFVFAARGAARSYRTDGDISTGGRYGPYITHDATGAPVMIFDSPAGDGGGGEDPPLPYPYRVLADGAYSDGQGVRGALVRGGELMFGLQTSRSLRFWRLVVGFKRPVSKG